MLKTKIISKLWWTFRQISCFLFLLCFKLKKRKKKKILDYSKIFLVYVLCPSKIKKKHWKPRCLAPIIIHKPKNNFCLSRSFPFFYNQNQASFLLATRKDLELLFYILILNPNFKVNLYHWTLPCYLSLYYVCKWKIMFFF